MVIISPGNVTVYTPTKKPKAPMTVKQWKKFPELDKELMLEKFDVILTDHKTKAEKTIGILKKFNLKNLDKGLKTFDGYMKQFDKGMEKGLGKNKGRQLDMIYGPRKKKSGRKSKRKSKKQSNPADQIWGKSSNPTSKIFGRSKTKVKVW